MLLKHFVCLSRFLCLKHKLLLRLRVFIIFYQLSQCVVLIGSVFLNVEITKNFRFVFDIGFGEEYLLICAGALLILLELLLYETQQIYDTGHLYNLKKAYTNCKAYYKGSLAADSSLNFW